MKWPHNCVGASGTCQMGEHARVSHSLPALLDVSIANLWCQRLADGGWEGGLLGGGLPVLIWCAFSGSNLLNWYSRFGGLPTKLQAVLGATFASGAEISAVCSVVYMSYKRCTQRLLGQKVAQSVFPLFFFSVRLSRYWSFELVLAGSKLVQDCNHLFKTKLFPILAFCNLNFYCTMSLANLWCQRCQSLSLYITSHLYQRPTDPESARAPS